MRILSSDNSAGAQEAIFLLSLTSNQISPNQWLRPLFVSAKCVYMQSVTAILQDQQTGSTCQFLLVPKSVYTLLPAEIEVSFVECRGKEREEGKEGS